jgi:hypothetical protein
MEKFEQPYEYNGTEYHLTLYFDREGEEQSVFLLQDWSRPGSPSLASNREGLAADLAKALDTTPDKIQWYEAAGERIERYDFHPHEYTFRPYREDLSLRDYTEAERRGDLAPSKGLAYTHERQDSSWQEIEQKVGHAIDRPETRAEWELRQQREFQEWSHQTDWGSVQHDIQPQL